MIATIARLRAFCTVGVIVLTSLSFLLMLGTPAQSATFTWDAGGGNRNWSTPENWEGGGAPASASDTTVVFGGSPIGQALQPIQDIADPFQLNRLEILTGVGTFSISGLPLAFVADGATQPALYSTRASTSTLSNDIVIPDGTTLHVDLTTYHLNFTGVISGEGGIDKSRSAGGIDLTNSANSFSGGLTIRASDGNWRKVNVRASGAMGTGPVNLHGGTLGTSYTSPGGLVFFGTTSHANTVNLFEDSPIFAGLPAGTADVELTGNVNLGTRTLHLRGGGIGTITGEVTGSGGVIKSDSGTWTLSGSNTYTGATTISDGVLSVDTLADGGSPSSIGQSSNARANLVINNSTLRYTGGSTTTDRRFTLQGETVFDVVDENATLTFSGLYNGSENSVFGSVIVKDGPGKLVFQRSGGPSAHIATIGAIAVNEGTLATGTGSSSVQINLNGLEANGATITMGDGAVLSLATALVNTAADTNQIVRYTGTNATATVSSGMILGGPNSGGLNTKTFDVNDGAADIDLHVSSSFSIYPSNPPAVSNLVKTGEGTLKLSGSDSRYVGETIVRDGRLVVGADAPSGANGSLGNATSAVRMGDADTPAGAALALVTDGALTIGRDVDVHDFDATTTLGGISNHTSTFSGTVTLSKDVFLTSAATGANATVFSGPITGSGGIAKTGGGVVTLSGPNTYDGATTIHRGTLALGAANVIPDGSGKDDVVLDPAAGQTATFDLNGFSATINGLSSSGDGTSLVDNTGAAAATLTVGNNDATSTFAGTIQNTGGHLSLIKTGDGTLTLSGSNTYTGATTITGGVLSVDSLADGGSPSGIGQSSNAAGNLIFNGGALRYTGGDATTDRRFTNQYHSVLGAAHAIFDVADADTTLTFRSVQNSSFGGGNGVIVKDGPGTLLFGRQGHASTYLTSIGAFVVNEGHLGTLLSHPVQINVNRTEASGAAITMGDGATLSLATALEVQAVNTNQIVRYTGTTATATISGGFILSGPGGGGFNTKTFDVNNGSANIDLHVSSNFGIYSGGGANPPAISNLVKAGEGTLEFSGNSLHRGATLVDAGTLALSHTSSNNNIAASPLVQVGLGATLDVTGLPGSTFVLADGQTLGGDGTVAGNVDLPEGAALSPGMSVGELHLTGNLAFDAGAFFDVDIEDLDRADLVQMAGGTLAPGGATIRVSLLNDFNPDYHASWTILTGEGAIDGDLFNPDVSVIEGHSFLAAGKWFDVSYGNSVLLTVVPEPSTLLMLAFGSLALLARRRRRRSFSIQDC